MDGQPYSYVVKVGGREYLVQVIPLDSTRFKVLVEGLEVEVVVGGRQELVNAPAAVPTTAVPGAPKASATTSAEVSRSASNPAPVGGSAAPAVPAPAPKPQAPQQPAWPTAAPLAPGTTVDAPIPGKVLRVLVNVGDAVAPGQLVATLESMKMEVQVFSSRGGRVREVRVRPGDFVNVGDPLLVLE